MQQPALLYLRNILKNNALGHAYVLEGEEGIGKKTLVNNFCQSLFCEAENRPAAFAPPQKVFGKSHPDYREISPLADKTEITVDQIRAMTADLYIKPFLAEKKVYVIKEADALNTQAQNAMLKVFEEPPGFAVIFLLANHADNLLSTISSRAVHVKLSPFSREEIVGFVAKNYPELAPKAEFIADFSGGVVGKAKNICENQAFLSLRRGFTAFCQSFGPQKAACFEISEYFIQNKEQQAVLFELFLLYLGDVLRAGLSGGKVVNQDYGAELSAFSQKSSKKRVCAAICRAAGDKENAARRANYALWVKNMVLNCWEELNGTGSWSPV